MKNSFLNFIESIYYPEHDHYWHINNYRNDRGNLAIKFFSLPLLLIYKIVNNKKATD